jgi:hypothetical protein
MLRTFVLLPTRTTDGIEREVRNVFSKFASIIRLASFSYKMTGSNQTASIMTVAAQAI